MQQSTITIPLHSPCRTQCVFCKFKKPDKEIDDVKEWRDIQKRIEEAGKSNASLVGFGHYIYEPAEFSFLPEALKLIKGHKKKTFINSNGKRLVSLDYAKTLHGLLDRVNISIFSSSDKECSFYMQEEISYKYKLQAIENSLINNINVSVTIILLKPSLESFKDILYSTQKFWNNKYFNKTITITPAVAVMGKTRDKVLVPSYSEVKELIEKNKDIFESLYKKYSLKFSISNIPKCFEVQKVEGMNFFYHSSDKKKKKIEGKTADDISNKSYTKYCNQCSHKLQCDGIYSEYLTVYGEEEFNSQCLIRRVSFLEAKKVIAGIKHTMSNSDNKQLLQSDKKSEAYYKQQFPLINKLSSFSLFRLIHSVYTINEISFHFLESETQDAVTVYISKDYKDFYMLLADGYKLRYEKSIGVSKNDIVLFAFIKKIFLKRI